MRYTIDRLQQAVLQRLADGLGAAVDEADLVRPKPNTPADLVFLPFRIAKQLGIAPASVAERAVAVLNHDPPPGLGAATAAGSFVNLRVAPGTLAAAVLAEVESLGAHYGHDDLGAGQTVVVEYSSPNMARRLHIGHIRSTIIGQALANGLRALGYRVISDSHIGDWGKNIGILLTALEHEGAPAGDETAVLAQLEELYARYTRLAASEPAIDAAARAWSLRLEAGDPATRARWQWIVELTLRSNQPLYDRLGVHFDTVLGESFYEDRLAPIMAQALASGVARRGDDGALVVDLPPLPTFLLQRQDGGTLYHTRDVATIAYRVETYRPTAIIYVVDLRQELYFQQLFALARALGLVPDCALVHVGFGVVLGADGQPLAARRGTMIPLQSLLDEAQARARPVVAAASPELTAAEQAAIAETVGIGALLFNDLSQSAHHPIALDWERLLSLQGDSAPYVQYMHARCCSILRRAAALPAQPSVAAAALLTHPAETALVLQLARLPLAVRAMGARFAPLVLADWCSATARAVAIVYRDCPVLTAPSPDLRSARLALIAAAAQALRNGLALLGIGASSRL